LTVVAYWRFAIENAYRPLRHGVPVLRGLVRLEETIQALAPESDAFLHGLKDYRLTRLLGDVDGMLEPMYWFGRLDKIATLLVTSPRVLDDAITTAMPDRAAADRRAPLQSVGPRFRWLLPAYVALTTVGLGYGRAGAARNLVGRRRRGRISFAWLLAVRRHRRPRPIRARKFERNATIRMRQPVGHTLLEVCAWHREPRIKTAK
jgi:hypothetical protein